jgi:hypothetical protein
MKAGLPDGIFSNQKKNTKNDNFSRNLQCWYILWPLDLTIWYILWPFGTFNGYLEYLTRFGMLYQENLATLDESRFERFPFKREHFEN